MNNLKNLEIVTTVFCDAIKADDESKDWPLWMKNNVISNESSISSGYDISLRPFFKEIGEAFLKNNSIKKITIQASTGLGKSAFMIALTNYIMAVEPGPTIICFPTDSEASNFAETRLYPTLNANPKLVNLMPTKNNGQRKTEIISPHMNLWMIGGNLSSTQSKSCRYVMCDEVWQLKQGILGELLARTHNRWNSKVLMISQGSYVGDDWHSFYEDGKVMEYGFECTECHEHFPFKLSYLKWDNENKDLTLIQKSETTYLECPNCKKRYNDDIVTRRSLVDNGKFIPRSSKPLYDHLSFNINALAIYDIPWKETVLQFLRCNEKAKLQNDKTDLHKFMQKRLAQAVGIADQQQSLELKYDDSISISGFEVKNEIARMMGVDVQRDCYYAVIYAVDDNSRVYLKAYKHCETLADLKSFQDEYNVEPYYVFVDGADGVLVDQIRLDCYTHGWIVVNATKSKSYRHEDGSNNLYSELFYQNLNGVDGVVPQINYSSQNGKSFFSNINNLNMIHIPKDVTDSFKLQMTSQAQFLKMNKVTGKNEWSWQEVKKGANKSHYFDASVCIVIMMLREGYIDITKDE